MVRKFRKGFSFLFSLRQNYMLRYALSLVKYLLSSAILSLMGITRRTGFYCVKWQVSICSYSVLEKIQIFLHTTIKTFAFTKSVSWCFTRLMRSKRIRIFFFACTVLHSFSHIQVKCSVTVKLSLCFFNILCALKWLLALSFSHIISVAFAGFLFSF